MDAVGLSPNDRWEIFVRGGFNKFFRFFKFPLPLLPLLGYTPLACLHGAQSGCISHLWRLLF